MSSDASDYAPDYLQRLGLGTEVDERAIKRAYARELKRIDQATELARFAQLREDYANALAFVQGMSPFLQAIVPPNSADSPLPEAQAMLSPITLYENDGETDAGADIQADESFPAPPAHEIALQLLADFSAAVLAIPVVDRAAITQVLRHWLLSDALLGLDVRESFELALIHALAYRTLGQHSGPLLVVADDVYGWSLGENQRLPSSGTDGRYLMRLLDEACGYYKRELDQWFLLAGDPIEKDVVELLIESEAFRSKSPLLFEYFFSDGHFTPWLQLRKQEPIWRSIKRHVAPIYRNSPMLQFFASIAWVPVIIFVLVVGGTYLGGKQAKQIDPTCDKQYAEMIGKNWRDVDLSEVNQLKSCAAHIAPTMCSDRADMLAVLSHADRLMPQNSYYWFSGKIHLRASNGLGFAPIGPEPCEAAWNIVTQTNWLDFGDELAARNVLSEIARCPEPGNDIAKTNTLKFLKQIDWWPSDNTMRPLRPAIALHDLIGLTSPENLNTVVKPQASWVACENTPGLVLASSPEAFATGPMERVALSLRETRKLLKTSR